jgi:hypothetical protein
MDIDHDDLGEGPDGPELSTYTVEANGCFGSATWVVGKKLYDLLPRKTRDELLAMTGDRKIAPFLTGTCERLLRQADCSVAAKNLNPTWSFQTADVACGFGQVTWQIGEGFWEELPEDQRDSLIEVAEVLIHGFFHDQIHEPLMMYALRKLQG